MKNIVITILAILVVVLGGYVVYDKFMVEKKESTNQTEEKNDTSEKNTNSRVGLDISKCKNCNVSGFDEGEYYSYGILADEYDPRVYLDSSRKVKVDSIDTEGYRISGVPTAYEITNFDKDVVDIIIYSDGMDIGSYTLLYLMSDGTVEYTPLYDALRNQTFKSYGRLEGIEDVVRFYKVAVVLHSEVRANAYNSVLVQTSDGSYYDLHGIMVKIRESLEKNY